MPFKIVETKYGHSITSTGEKESTIKLGEDELWELWQALTAYMGIEGPEKRMKAVETALGTLAEEMRKQSMNLGNGMAQVLQAVTMNPRNDATVHTNFVLGNLEGKIDRIVKTTDATAAAQHNWLQSIDEGVYRTRAERDADQNHEP